MKKITTEITVETEEILIIRRRGSAARPYCRSCREQTRMITIEEAMALASGSLRAILRRVEAGEIHYEETAGGLLLVCPTSLLRLPINAS